MQTHTRELQYLQRFVQASGPQESQQHFRGA